MHRSPTYPPFCISRIASSYSIEHNFLRLSLSDSISDIISDISDALSVVRSLNALYASPILPAAFIRGAILKATSLLVITPAIDCFFSSAFSPLFFILFTLDNPSWTIRRFSSTSGTKSATVAKAAKSR